jgi:predicted membrane protein
MEARDRVVREVAPEIDVIVPADYGVTISSVHVHLYDAPNLVHSHSDALQNRDTVRFISHLN